MNFSIPVSSLCIILSIVFMDVFESTRRCLIPLIICLTVILVSYFIVNGYLLYIHNLNETWFHSAYNECPKGPNCVFKKRYIREKIRRKYSKVMSKENANKLLKKIKQKTATQFCYKTKGIEPLQPPITTEECFICTEGAPRFMHIPCLHSGICIKCGLNSLNPSYQVYSKKEFKCPICRNKSKNVLFYSKDQNGGLQAVGFDDLPKELGISDSVFHSKYST